MSSYKRENKSDEESEEETESKYIPLKERKRRLVW